jgi:CDP-diglyceride synthetase
MSAVIILLALSAVIGFALGCSFSWFTILISSVVLAVLSSLVLQVQGFGALPGIAIVAACLAADQAAYLVGVFLARHRSETLLRERADKETRHKVPPWVA